jgi:hypothetical protein
MNKEELCFIIKPSETNYVDLYCFLVNNCSFNYVLNLYRMINERLIEILVDKE